MKKEQRREHRPVDMEVIVGWVEDGSRVLDLGCGHGVLLEFLAQRRTAVQGVGVDLNAEKIRTCIGKGLTVYQGDMGAMMRSFPEGFFDRVICSRTVQELNLPTEMILEGLRVGRNMTIGFVNNAFWKNRLSMSLRGTRVRNEVHPLRWFESQPINPLSVLDFEAFCREKNILIVRRHYLQGDWRTPCRFLPNLFCGYALYDLRRGKAVPGEATEARFHSPAP